MTPAETEALQQQLAINTVRMKELVEQQFNVEVTRPLVLCFSADNEDCARSLNRALFAKGTRVLDRDPARKADGRFHIRVGVKRSLRDAVREDFVADMVHTAAQMDSTFEGWNMLTNEAAEDTQEHPDAPNQTPA